MSHNPNEIKSQHELNDGKRSSDVLLEAISKAERLQKQLDIAVEVLWKVCDCREDREYYSEIAEQALAEIKELDNEIPNQE